jgi:pimeloyl-ACP methyl ester carboxylesterase
MTETVAPPGPVLLLHGQPGSARDWDRVVSALDGHAQAIALDRPGWDGGPPRDLAGNGRAALAALDARGLERAVVAGHSLGGTIATWLAVHHPDRVAALVLAAPAANLASVEPIDRWLAAPVIGDVAGAVSLSALGLALTAAPLRRRIAGGSGLEARYLADAGRSLLAPRAWRAFAAEQRALLRELPGLEAGLSDISAPTTILIGATDRIVSRRSAVQLARQIPGARMSVIERAGHLLPQRHAERIAEAIAQAVSAATRA